MKNLIKILVCSVVLSIAGYNARVVMGLEEDASNLELSDVEMMAEGEGFFSNLFHWQHKEYGMKIRVEYPEENMYVDLTPCITVSGPGRDKCTEHIEEWHRY